MKKIILNLTFAFLTLSYIAQAPAIQWQKSLGGSGEDNAYSIQQCSDGGFIVAGITRSYDGDVSGNHGGTDYWIVKLNNTGDIQWQKSLGGSGEDIPLNIQQCSDGGFIVAGITSSYDGDVSGKHSGVDSWIVKLNNTGDIQWQKSLGGSGYDYSQSIQQCSDGGFIVAGVSTSNDGDVSGNHGGTDYWIVKLNNTGDIQWQKSLGGSGNDNSKSIQQCSDGGFIVAGFSTSNDGDVSENYGVDDYWIVKLNNTGDIQWQRSMGGSGEDYAFSIQQCFDGGFIVIGYSTSNDGDVSGNHGNFDYWIVKLNYIGAIQWQKSLGGNGFDYTSSIQQCSDGGYIVAGGSKSNNGDVSGNHGSDDTWIVKLNIIGSIEWQKSMGGSGEDYANGISLCSDGGIIISGATSSNDGDVSGNHGNFDSWIVKLVPNNLSTNSITKDTKITIFPNPTNEKITIKLEYYTPSQEITITDILGNTIKTQKLEGLSTIINTDGFEKGIYFMNLIEANKKTTQKFIVE